MLCPFFRASGKAIYYLSYAGKTLSFNITKIGILQFDLQVFRFYNKMRGRKSCCFSAPHFLILFQIIPHHFAAIAFSDTAFMSVANSITGNAGSSSAITIISGHKPFDILFFQQIIVFVISRLQCSDFKRFTP